MNIEPTSIPDVKILVPDVLLDERGFFMETFNRRWLSEAGLPAEFVQDNHSGSKQGVLRGLHYQVRQPQGKLVRVVTGEVFDVAVDLRRSSETFGRWIGVTLSAATKQMVWIPAGFAHGFYVLSVWADLLYKVTAPYAPKWDRALRWDDPALGIEWPLIEGVAAAALGEGRPGTRICGC